MFELEKAIQDWRSGLLQNQNVLESDADELESHVRDEVDSLMLAGLSAEEAFMVSTHRIGDNNAVGQEFAKVNVKEIWRNRVFWMLSGVFVFMIIGSISSFFTGTIKLILAWIRIDPTIVGIISYSVYICVFVLLVFLLIFHLGGLGLKIYKRHNTLRDVLLKCILFILVLKVATLFIPAFIVKVVYSSQEYGEMLLSSQPIQIAWQIAWPIVLVVLLLWLRPSKRETTAA